MEVQNNKYFARIIFHSVKIHICDVTNSRLWLDYLQYNSRRQSDFAISPFREGSIFTKSAKFRGNISLTKFSEFTVPNSHDLAPLSLSI